MTEVSPKERLAGKPLKREVFAEMLAMNFEKLPDIDKSLYLYGSFYLAGNSAFVGLIANSLYRRSLNVSQAGISAMLPMAVMPFMTTYALYNATVSTPLLSGSVNCPTCVLLRGALVGALSGAVYPIALALPLNFGLAVRYRTAPMPEKGNLPRYWLDVSRPVWRRMRAAVLLQTLFGTYLGSRDFETYGKLVQLTVGSRTEELELD
ncbi:transmembrane protein 126A [Synchiropus splendidus]|uniref:transmembrane protein 126A n=1 Tax=Synchiropus splendidus TaxID=270530 RepID=UPI00237D5ACC|nr:transmembrane protein 126A [Synchiropus splendidus]